jgi:DNA mismatch repair protein MutS
MVNILDIPTNNLTPGMRQYQEAKRANPDCIILLRMGDFYELFYEDAVTASKELEITLTSRGKDEKQAPLAGVPYHALENYLGRLVKKGYKVAIIEQLEDPKEAKGLVKRGLVRIVTPGTVIDSSMLSDKENNYISAIKIVADKYSLAYCDLSTGEFCTAQYTDLQSFINELSRLNSSECIVPESLRVNQEIIEKIKSTGCFLNFLDDFFFKEEQAKKNLLNHFTSLSGLESFGVSGGLLKYLMDTQKNSLSHIKVIAIKSNQQTMLLDSNTLKNLELLESLNSKGTLISILDKTVTSMGSRLLKKWLKTPLLNKTRINYRLQAVKELHQAVISREEIISLLNGVYDLERLIGRINYGNASPKDLLALRNSLRNIPKIKDKLISFKSNLLLKIKGINSLTEILTLIDWSIKEDASITIREGNIIKTEYNQELKNLHQIKSNSKQFLAELEEKEKQKTGISNLKISFNRVFGYFIEVTKRNNHLIQEEQTTVNSERYITEELKVLEEKILGAEEKIRELEFNLFQDIINEVSKETIEIQKTASKLAILDVLCCFSKISMENNYNIPKFVEENVIQIKNGRHPVLEKLTSNFITNDILVNRGEIMIITGPNMAGKSSVMRQTALIVLMAQIGCFVPADECILTIVDRIFTRVGAHDDLSTGQSTFMVEMLETAAILNNATEKSLIILDEIGRGTSTFDGVSIAWSVAEHIYNNIKAKTMFATHYHVMNKLADKFENVNNYNIAVKELNGELVFLRKLVPGGTDQSHGIHVAKLAGLPKEVIERAKEVQGLLEKDDKMTKKIKVKKFFDQKSLDGF